MELRPDASSHLLAASWLETLSRLVTRGRQKANGSLRFGLETWFCGEKKENVAFLWREAQCFSSACIGGGVGKRYGPKQCLEFKIHFPMMDLSAIFSLGELNSLPKQPMSLTQLSELQGQRQRPFFPCTKCTWTLLK